MTSEDTVTWKCPLCPCGLTEPASEAPGRYARLKHRLEHHAKADPKLFRLDRRTTAAVSIRRAQQQRRAGVMNKRIRDGKDSIHAWMPIRRTTGKRKGRTDVVCSACGKMASSLAKLERMKCKRAAPGDLGWQRRRQFIDQMKNEQKKAVDDNLRQHLAAVLRAIELLSNCEQLPKHVAGDVMKFQWPKGF